MYVALTRARDVLHVYAPLRYHHTRQGRGDRHSYAPLSRFLSPLRHRFDEATDTAGDPDDASTLDPHDRVTVADEVDASTHRLWTL